MTAPESPSEAQAPPRVFISYAHESAAHKDWVKSLVKDMRARGVDALLDEWKVPIGGDFTLFMDSMRTCDRALLICTPTYARKANEGTGGVGYERAIITAELAKTITTAAFICVLRSGRPEEAIPTFARTRRYVDFRDDAEYVLRFEELLRELHGAPREPEPPIGPNPFVTPGETMESLPSSQRAPIPASRRPAQQPSTKGLRLKVPAMLALGLVVLYAGWQWLDSGGWPGSDEMRPRGSPTSQPAAASGTTEPSSTGTERSDQPATPPVPVSNKPLKLDLGGGVMMELVRIPAGEFMMGSPKSEEGHDEDEEPQHRVRIGEPFYLGKYQVTQAQWRAVMHDDPSHFQGDDRPVERVSWHQCREFCQKLSEKAGRKIRLPTEAEWEYACRAGTTTPFSCGETISTDQANYGEHSDGTRRVGSFPANGFGLFDMHGNVWEWCEDVWHKNYNGAPTDGSAWVSGGDQTLRVLRGGSWSGGDQVLRCANRYWGGPDNRSGSSGFRVAAGT